MDLVEILKQSALEEGKELESESEERAITVLKLAEGLELTAAGIEVFIRALTGTSGEQQLDNEL